MMNKSGQGGIADTLTGSETKTLRERESAPSVF